MASTPSTKLLVLCTAAVGAIYAGAYVYTEPGAHASGAASSVAGTRASRAGTLGASAPSSASGTAPPSAASSSSPSSQASGSASSTTQPKSPAAASQPQYKDGTYTGSGSNPYGTLSAAVTIAHGKIASIRITSYHMHYPQSYIDPQLINEILKSQTYRVYAVSGATASSYNLAEAVYYALQKARAQ